MSDINDAERTRWGGPSPFAGQDTRTDAQRQAADAITTLRQTGALHGAEQEN